MIKVYDTFEKKSIVMNDPYEFLKEYGYYNYKNRKTIFFFATRTKYCLHRFIKEDFIHKMFIMYCIDDGREYHCVSSNGFLIQIGEECSRSNIHEINRIRCGGRTTISFSQKTYCLKKNKDSINNLMISKYKDSHLYRTKSKDVKIQRKISNLLRDRIRCAMKRSIAKKSEKTMDLIGCSISFLMNYLEEKFQEGMTWDNQGKWHIDHIVPCASFNLSNPEEQKVCLHYTNLQPLWALDNMRKGSKILK